MDTGYEPLGLEFEKALTVLTTVIHKRPGAAVTDAGLKACYLDQGPPAIRGYPGIGVVLKEEHAILHDEKDELAYLQKLEYEPAHCCSTVSLYDSYDCVRKGRWEASWTIPGRGKGR